MTTSLSKPLIIGISIGFVLLIFLGWGTYSLYQKASPYLSIMDNMTTQVAPTTSSRQASSNIKMWSICAADETKSDKEKVTPNLSQDLSKAYTMMDSLGVANLDMMTTWGKYLENLSQEAQIAQWAIGIRVIPIPNIAYTTTVLGSMGLMFSCSATDESGQTPCIELNLWPSLQTKTKLDAITNHYIREVISEKSTTTGESLIIEGTLGDPGNIIIRSIGKEGPSTLTTTRDSTWWESYTIESTKLTARMIENADCSGSAEIQTRDDDGETIDVSMKWSLSGNKTTGNLTSRSADPILSTTFSW